MAPVRFMMPPLWWKPYANCIRDVGSSKEIAPTGLTRWGASFNFLCTELPAHFHRLAFSHVGKKGDLASAVDLQSELALMFRTKARRSLGKDLSQTIHEMLQLFGSLIVERKFVLTNSAFSLSTVMEHNLERNLLRCACFRL